MHPIEVYQAYSMIPLDLFEANLSLIETVAEIHEGAKRNLRLLNALALRSVDLDTSGLQTMRWYPNDGRPDVEFEGHLGAPTLGEVTLGEGMKVGMIITIPDPSTITVLP